MPEITVLMPVRNGEKYIKNAIDSVLKQTFTDFEFIIIDNGSTDRTVEVIKEYKDERMRLERRKYQLIENLNEGLDLASGSYIAYMASDDIMHTERLRIQLKRMKKNTEITVCGTWAKIFSEEVKDRNVFHVGYEVIHEPLLELLKCNILLHSSVLIKKEFLFNHNIKYQNYAYIEDYRLWYDIVKAGGILFVEPQELLMLRKSAQQVIDSRKEKIFSESVRLRREILRYQLSLLNNEKLNNILFNFEELEKNKWISNEDIFRFFVSLLNRIKRC